jgi:hypothetical protein
MKIDLERLKLDAATFGKLLDENGELGPSDLIATEFSLEDDDLFDMQLDLEQALLTWRGVFRGHLQGKIEPLPDDVIQALNPQDRQIYEMYMEIARTVEAAQHSMRLPNNPPPTSWPKRTPTKLICTVA